MSAFPIAVIDYGMGNLHSVVKALTKVGAEPAILAERKDLTDQYRGLVLPGVGAFSDAMAGLDKGDWKGLIKDWIAADRPFLGICLGLQTLFEHSEEGDVAGLGVFAGEVRRFRRPPGFKVPHMGWNQVYSSDSRNPLMQDLPAEPWVYFVHSYHVVPTDDAVAATLADYGGKFVSSVRRGNCHATQFHPEKSQAVGLAIFRNFVNLCQ